MDMNMPKLGDDQQPQTVERKDPKILEALNEAPIYKKFTEIKAVVAQGGEVVETKLKDGTVETTNTANPGDGIVTNPGGEQYIVPAEKFGKRYEPKEGEDGVFVAKGHIRAIPNPWGTKITMMASWGEMQNGDENCMIADVYDPITGKSDGEPYIIGIHEFYETYKKAE